MSYSTYINWGTIQLKADIPEETVKEIEKMYMDAFGDEVDVEYITPEEACEPGGFFNIHGYQRDYKAKEIKDALRNTAQYVASGEIECTGEADEFWQFKFEGDQWLEKQGYRAYETGFGI